MKNIKSFYPKNSKETELIARKANKIRVQLSLV